MEQKFFIDGRFGKIACVHHSPNPTIQAPLVLCMHSFTSNKDRPRMVLWARDLAAAGYHAVRFDSFGHGESGGNFSDLTIPKMQQTIEDVYDYCKALPMVDGSKLGLMGHSLGGYNALLFAATHQQSGALPRPVVKAVVSISSPAHYNNTVQPIFGTTRENWEKAGIASVPNTDGKPLSLKFDYLKSFESFPLMDRLDRLTVPTLIVHGNKDGVVPFSQANELFEKITAPKKLAAIDGADHGFSQSNSSNQVSEAMVDWFRQYVK